MWLSGQQKRPVQGGGGRTGAVTMSGGELAVELDGERRGLEGYGPAGYRWMPKVGQQVLVVQGKGETPCIAGVRQGDGCPDQVVIQAGSLDLQAEVLVRGVPLDVYIAAKAAELTGGLA